jgi:hypothetical protein
MRHVTTRIAIAAAAALSLGGCDAGTKPGEAPKGPEVRIVAPRADQVFEVVDGKHPVEVVIDLRNYEIGKVEDGKNGQHVHLILDNAPYEAVYDVSKPFRLPLKEDAPPLAEGTHVLRAFPSAGPKDAHGALHHESRKNPGSFAWVKFHVKAPGGPNADFDPKAPLLTYSRPKGDYRIGSPEHSKFLIDFYVGNAKLGKFDDRVRGTLDGKVVGEWVAWERVVLPEPPAGGEHVMVLELLDRDGKPVPGPFNRTERKFKVSP